MTTKMSRRDMLKATATGAAGLVVGLNVSSALAAPPMQDAVTLRFQSEEGDYAQVIEAFNQEYPNINIEFVNITGVDHAEIA